MRFRFEYTSHCRSTRPWQLLSNTYTLAHKVGNHTVERASGVSEPLFSGAESTEVLGGL